MSVLSELLAAGQPVDGHRPWPRVWLHPDTWQDATNRLADGSLTLLSLWGETGRVHMALLATDPPRSLSCRWPVPTAAIRRSAPTMPRLSGWSGRSATCSAWNRSG